MCDTAVCSDNLISRLRPVCSAVWLTDYHRWQRSRSHHSRWLVMTVFALLKARSLLYSGSGVHPSGESGRNVKVPTYLHLVPSLRMRWAIPPLPHTSAWRGVSSTPGTTLPTLGDNVMVRLSTPLPQCGHATPWSRVTLVTDERFSAGRHLHVASQTERRAVESVTSSHRLYLLPTAWV